MLDGDGYDLGAAQEYYLLKTYYLLAISSTGDDWRKRGNELRACKADLKKRLSRISACQYLKAKEKLVLRLAALSFRLARLAYKLKGGKR